MYYFIMWGHMSDMFLFAVGAPTAKRMRYADLDHSKAASWKDAPSEAFKSDKFAAICEQVPVYYHWFAMILQDSILRYEVMDPLEDQLPEDRLTTLLEQLESIESKQIDENEYYCCSSVLHLALQQFFFTYEDRKSAACLSQYPVKNTRRPDCSIHTLKDYFSNANILFMDYKLVSLLSATGETIAYFENANEDSKEYSWAFGLPSTPCTHAISNVYICQWESACY